jgi:hypothetical protein
MNSRCLLSRLAAKSKPAVHGRLDNQKPMIGAGKQAR